MAIKGIIFDLDGILFDSEYFQWQGWVQPLRNFGIELTKEMYFEYAGKSSSLIESELIKKYNLPIKEGELIKQKKELLRKWFSEKPLPLMPYAKEAVEYFSLDPRFKVALCSGGDREEILTKLKMNDFLKYFSVIVAGDDVQHSKPAPDIYLLAVKLLNLNPDECLAFEDTQYGLQAAKEAGLCCFAIPNEYSNKQDFSLADKILTSLNDAIIFFEKHP
ncbi:MAG TPA: HAD family phosphatase [Candidatus Paceibacterota bacterium]|jgi:HAD superfamily hydrolase (TIGR01509 family)|nr:HAD family phosphatase [Candidatus Pacearchaeota archaeon]HRR94590.1 HAD family phosphatase [Candidatus Paceibacterota bacterium]HRU20674.1 HAD family phosphatase [Candidatus Paceibacterota bacterium]